MSKWKSHKSNWSDCTECPLCETRKKTVLFKGKIPCDCLFVGEAPGVSENVLGKPFVGPAGKLLDRVIAKTIDPKYRLGFTNLVGCIPLDDNNEKLKQPSAKSIKACKPRLEDIIHICKPTVLVCVGSLAAKNLTVGYIEETFGFVHSVIETLHPAAILRAENFQQGLMIQRLEIALEEVNESLEVPF